MRMIYVERRRGIPWADARRKGGQLDVELIGDQLQIVGLLPLFESKDHPSNLLRQYELARKDRSVGKQRTGKDSPNVRFANANSDAKLVAFVRTFGPVVAKHARLLPESTFEGRKPSREELLCPAPDPMLLIALQDMEELRNECSIYRAALSLSLSLNDNPFDFSRAQSLICEIAERVGIWPMQWTREQSQRKSDPLWKLTDDSLQRIRGISSGPSDLFLPANFDARIVICELLNVFHQTIFPSVLAMHGSILFGLRPLLYEILRRELLYPHDVQVCANSHCRNFFEIEREGQNFCSTECSLSQRQREYWSRRGKKMRKKRLKKKKT